MLLERVVFPHLKLFRENKKLQEFALEMPEAFNVERLVELSLAEQGNMRFVDEEGYDFLPDYSDSKTVTVNETSYQAEIGSVENKIGALRICAYNPIKGDVDFFYVSRRELKRIKLACHGVHSHKERVKFRYSKRADHYGYFEEFRVKNFKELAEMRS